MQPYENTWVPNVSVKLSYCKSVPSTSESEHSSFPFSEPGRAVQAGHERYSTEGSFSLRKY